MHYPEADHLMEGTLTLWNYRCFDWAHPATLRFSNGFTAVIGTNNSGKSTLLRAVYELRPFLGNLNALFNDSSGRQINGDPLGVSDPEEIANELDPKCVEFEISIDDLNPSTDGSHLKAVSLRYRYLTSSRIAIAKSVTAIDQTGGKHQLDSGVLRSCRRDPNGRIILAINGSNRLLHISDLRDFASTLNKARYFPAFRNAINTGGAHYYDLPVGTALVEAWDGWKAGTSREKKRHIAKVESEIAELLGFEKIEINAEQSNKSLDVNIDGRPHKLYEIGAGIAQLIITLASALTGDATYILIDEPELNLHPGLQVKFISTLGAYASHGLIFSTHSIGLARSVANKILVIKKLNKHSSELSSFDVQFNGYGEWLGELSYSSRAELGCDRLLFVEGETDVMCFQEFLRKEKLDHKYVILSLGGGANINGDRANYLNELLRLVDAKNIRMFIDSERDAENAPIEERRQKFINDCKALNISIVESKRRAMENYFELNALRRAFRHPYAALGPYERLGATSQAWRKSANWRIARETDIADIQDTDLWQFVMSLKF